MGLFWFKLRSAILEDGGTGIIGIGRMGFGDICSLELLEPNERLSTELSPVPGNTKGLSDTGKVDMGNPPRLLVKCGGGGRGRATVSCSSSIDEPTNCKLKPHNHLIMTLTYTNGNRENRYIIY